MKATIGGYQVELTPQEFRELTGQKPTMVTAHTNTPSVPTKKAQTPASKPKITPPKVEHRKHQRWATEEIELLKALAKAGKTRKEAATAVGRTYVSVDLKASELGIQFDDKHTWKRWTPEETGKCIALARQGKTHVEIAAALGRSEGSIHLALNPIKAKVRVL